VSVAVSEADSTRRQSGAAPCPLQQPSGILSQLAKNDTGFRKHAIAVKTSGRGCLGPGFGASNFSRKEKPRRSGGETETESDCRIDGGLFIGSEIRTGAVLPSFRAA
jgi:hypothetical protein